MLKLILFNFKCRKTFKNNVVWTKGILEINNHIIYLIFVYNIIYPDSVNTFLKNQLYSRIKVSF